MGKTPSGEDVLLLPWQEVIVRELLQWSRTGKTIVLPVVGHGGGKSVILATAAWLDSGGDPHESETTEHESRER